MRVDKFSSCVPHCASRRFAFTPGCPEYLARRDRRNRSITRRDMDSFLRARMSPLPARPTHKRQSRAVTGEFSLESIRFKRARDLIYIGAGRCANLSWICMPYRAPSLHFLGYVATLLRQRLLACPANWRGACGKGTRPLAMNIDASVSTVFVIVGFE